MWRVTPCINAENGDPEANDKNRECCSTRLCKQRHSRREQEDEGVVDSWETHATEQAKQQVADAHMHVSHKSQGAQHSI